MTKVVIESDFDVESPREWDNFGTLYVCENRYFVGDGDAPKADGPLDLRIQVLDLEEEVSELEDELYNELTLVQDYEHEEALGTVGSRVRDMVKKRWDADYFSLPVYHYTHSGTVINTTGFSCPWDSGLCGEIYVSLADAIDRFRTDLSKHNPKGLPFSWDSVVKSDEYGDVTLAMMMSHVLKGEVSVYSDYLSGNVYGFQAYKENEDGSWEEADSCWGFYGSDAKENGMVDHLPKDHEFVTREEMNELLAN